ncbi:MAG: peptide chain release factor N(5)-glutamine methyltransferase [Desulfobacteraceae bacterium]|nr:MAG: peptide chain release factor N(5)-glutamine methyltransferase [Desulfobacteraceae bacterium]
MRNQQKQTEPEWTIIKLLQWTSSYFKSNGIDSPRATAEILLAHTLRLKRIDLYLRHDQPLNRGELDLFKSLIKRRKNREPVAYIVGVKEFWSMELEVSQSVLIPRPETECLVEEAVSVLGKEPLCNSNPNKRDSIQCPLEGYKEDYKIMSCRKNAGHDLLLPKRILEMGTGSGAVILAIASQKPGHHYFASDISIDAVGIAIKNAKQLGFENYVSFFCGNWFLPLREKENFFDVIISNPPYIRKNDIRNLQPEINRFEPQEALDGGDDGLDHIKHIIKHACRFLNNEGNLLLEIGHDQKDAVDDIIKETGNYKQFYFRKDYSGFDRVVCATKS